MSECHLDGMCVYLSQVWMLTGILRHMNLGLSLGLSCFPWRLTVLWRTPYVTGMPPNLIRITRRTEIFMSSRTNLACVYDCWVSLSMTIGDSLCLWAHSASKWLGMHACLIRRPYKRTFDSWNPAMPRSGIIVLLTPFFFDNWQTDDIMFKSDYESENFWTNKKSQ